MWKLPKDARARLNTSRTRPRRDLKPAITPLDRRDVPAAYTFSGGVLGIDMSQLPTPRSFAMDAANGIVHIDGRATGQSKPVAGAPGGQLKAADVKRIVVIGSESNDIIDLSRVDGRGFSGLNGQVLIDGRGQADTIRGTAFNDQILGGAGDDRILGNPGDDTIWGGDGNDNIWGDGSGSGFDLVGGNDRIDGGAGNDGILGRGGNDILVGRAGKDTFWGDGGIDQAYIDTADAYKKAPPGVERVLTTTPPTWTSTIPGTLPTASLILPTAAPSNLRADNVWATKVDLRWNDNSSNETGFDVIAIGGDIKTWWYMGTAAPDRNGFRVENLKPGTTYQFQVKAASGTGGSEWSNIVTVNTPAPPVVAPPSNLRSDSVWATKVDLRWDDNSVGETGFDVIALGGDLPSWWYMGTATPDRNTFRVENLRPNTTYQFQVKAASGTGGSEWSNIVTVTTKANDMIPPSNLRAENVWSTKVDLKWDDNTGNETGFDVIAIGGDLPSWWYMGTAAPDRNGFRVENLKPNTTYRFQVKAASGTGGSEWSNIIEVTTRGEAPAAPTNLRAENVWAGAIDLRWDDKSSNESGFRIAMSRDEGLTWDNVGEVGANATSLRVENLKPATRYLFQVRAAVGASYSDPTGPMLAVTRVVDSIESANLRVQLASSGLLADADATNLGDGTKVQVWVGHGGGNQAWALRREAGGTYSIWNVAANKVLDAHAPDTGLNGCQVQLWTWLGGINQRWYVEDAGDGQFVIRNAASGKVLDAEAGQSAFNGGKLQLWDDLGGRNQRWNLGLASLNGPANLRTDNVWATRVDLRWDDLSGNESGFRIAISRDGGLTWDNVGEVGANLTTFRVENLKPGTRYLFRVRAANGSGFSVNSLPLGVQTKT